MGDPHNQDVVKVVFVKDNITSVIEIGKSATIEVVDRCPPSSPFKDKGIAHEDISTLHVDIEYIHGEGLIRSRCL
jgi:hypothetical protein